ncbi:MAG: DUF1330 domain-containing protein [Halioglobus sp.]
MRNQDTVNELVSFYGESPILPSRAQWEHLVMSKHSGSICMVNFMKFREQADYSGEETVSGMEAILRYHAVSQRKVTEVGGEFVAEGSFGGMMIGGVDDWDAVGIVRYPNIDAFLQLFSDTEYREAHTHRLAGTLRHKMTVMLEH